ncbi:MAG: hypothetical protein CM15mP103_12480 [Gammaproteobacteria bacterium]|nr:MAG: hypothetical protein CM15mP103_12480 [Gammaproteobacteria bacterium]
MLLAARDRFSRAWAARRKFSHAGPAGAGQVAKAANNMLLAVHMIGTCEALAMGEAHGLNPAVLSDIMKASSGNNWSLQVYNPGLMSWRVCPPATIINPALWSI